MTREESQGNQHATEQLATRLPFPESARTPALCRAGEGGRGRGVGAEKANGI